MNFDINRLSKLAGLPASESGVLTEAQNRSKHDDPGIDGPDQAEQVNETEEEDPDDDEVLEVDENELREAVASMRKQNLEESRLREAVRGEIRTVLEDLGMVESDSRWVYGDNQPTNSRKGLVNLAFPGIGFK
ncbi:hypothetical protein CMI47_18960 [Candidatus Pacearchaeota archaeon]|nr:hypothetical protein [Candidatus Pacearchaeota archaeon]|tara:strand:- start:14001 stop:14399 length:399 start_codon:yes stop_codon:yes gene_type:complete